MRARAMVRALLIDLNGTLHVGSEPTAAAVRAVEKLREADIPFVFCSNNTKESTGALLEKLRGMGFTAHKHEVMTSLGACRQLVEDRGLRPYLLLSDSAKGEFASLPSGSSDGRDEAFDSVILGLHEPSLSYGPLNMAFRILKGEPIGIGSTLSSGEPKRRPPVLIAPHASMFHQAAETDDLPAGLSLGIGPFVRTLEAASGVEAELVGKPTKRFFELALQRLREAQGRELRNEDVAVVGDDVQNDLGGGAMALGLKRVLVRTGKYRPEDEHCSDPPDQTFDTFAAFVDQLVQSP